MRLESSMTHDIAIGDDLREEELCLICGKERGNHVAVAPDKYRCYERAAWPTFVGSGIWRGEPKARLWELVDAETIGAEIGRQWDG